MTLGLSAAADDRPRGRSGSAPCSRQPANPGPTASKLTNPFEGAFVSLEVEVGADEAEVDVGGRRAGALVV